MNLVFIIIDSLRHDFLELTDNKAINLKKLFDNGTSLNQLIVHAPETLNSMGSFLTGLYPYEHKSGMQKFSPEIKTLFHYLKDKYKIFMQVDLFPFGYSIESAKICDPQFYKQGVKDLNPTIEFIKKQIKPFFVFNHLFHLRTYKWADVKWRGQLFDEGKQDRISQTYIDGILYIDKLIESLLKVVDLTNTLLIVTSDHGETFTWYDTNISDSNLQCKVAGHGASRYDSAVKVPFVLVGPGIEEGLIIKKQIRQIDILPTILNLLDIPIPGNISGELFELDDNLIVEKPVFISETGHSKCRAVRTPEFKLIYHPDRYSLFRLYDLRNDPLEHNDVLETCSAKADELFDLAQSFFTEDKILSDKDLIAKHTGWKRLNDNWQILRDRFNGTGIKDLYSNISETYNNITGVSSEQYLKDIASMLNIKSDSEVLEVGIGTGIVGNYLLEFTENITGIDISPSMLQFVSEAINTLIGFADNIPVDDEVFDIVFGRQIYHNLNDSAILEAKRVLKKGGHFLIAEFIPPFNVPIDIWNSLRIKQEHRFFNTLPDIIKILQRHGLSKIRFRINKVKQAGLLNWIDNMKVKDKAEIFSRYDVILSNADYVKAVNLVKQGSDFRFDMYYAIVIGEKTDGN